ncbi:hypothetical protein MW887_001774 [Aspergillus wentii]|nr:hypothetical protein MW887_001774 [Aspergillus wentii]
MNRYRNAPGLRGPTKASASTLCQKCLKRDIYECTASAQERPYTSRPSRTQQLQNPRLRPQLTTEVPNDILRPNAADEILAKRDEERGRKREMDEIDPVDGQNQALKRARSESSHSMSSVSTISTSRSRSESPARGYSAKSNGNRAHSISSCHSKPRKRRHSDSSSHHSISSYSSGERARSRSQEWARDRNTRRRHRESSPEERGRPRTSPRGGGRRDRSRSRSMDKGRIAKERRSMTPGAMRERPSHPRRHSRDKMGAPDQSHRRPDYGGRAGPSSAQPRRERSLSPYSKRLALTQSMGR